MAGLLCCLTVATWHVLPPGACQLLQPAGCRLTAATPAQQAPPQDRAVFSARSDLVVVHVTVLDRRSGFVAGLPQDAFTVFEDGRPQAISFFSNEDSPVTVGLIVDNSTSMQRKRDALITAGMAFARSSHPDDELFALHFNERVWAGLPPGQPFTSSLGELRQALQRSTARGRTALFDAVASGIAHAQKGRAQKKVLVVISDGGDNASARKFDEVLELAARSDVVIYGIGLSDEYSEDADPGVLKQLARATGGEAYFPDRTEDVTRTLTRIARDIRSGYTIGYMPSGGAAEGYRRITVDVAAPGRKLAVRARSGYLASGAPHGR